MRLRAAILCSAVLLTITAGLPAAARAEDNAALQWNAAALEAVRRTGVGPPAVARALAIVHTCMYDAWAAYDPVALGVHFHDKDLTGSSEARRTRAVSHAAHRALLNLFPTQQALLDGVLLNMGYDPADVSDADSALGVSAAQAGLEARRLDGANQAGNYADTTGYVPYNTADALNDPGRWQPLTLGGVTQRFAFPQWWTVTPFAMTSADQFRPGRPAQFPHGSYRKQALAVLHLSAHLGDLEKVIATYWADGPRTETPPGHWCLLAQYVSRRDRHTLEQDVKMFFVLGNGLLDASIAAWDAKRAYDSARPITAIRFLFMGQPVRAWAGPYGGTRLIQGDAWRSYLPTPSFPEYVSGHSTFSAASAEILALMTGSDTFGAEVTIAAGSSVIEPGLVPTAPITLRWQTFSEAAEQAGMSRRYGGIHFEDGDREGRTMGRQIGRLVWQKAREYFTGAATAGGEAATAVLQR